MDCYIQPIIKKNTKYLHTTIMMLYQYYLSMFDKIYRLVLSPEDLYISRRSTQVKALKRSIDDALIVSERCVRVKSTTVLSMNASPDMDAFIADIIDKNKPSPSIIGIKVTEDDSVVLSLAVKVDDDSKKNACEKIVELPLVEFGRKLATAFEQQLTSTTLCFIADASCGLGSELLGEIVSSSGAGLVRKNVCSLSLLHRQQ